jgi:hypothetical protein
LAHHKAAPALSAFDRGNQNACINDHTVHCH